MNYPAAELRSIKMNFYLLNPDAEHRGILLIKYSTLTLQNFFIVGWALPTKNSQIQLLMVGNAHPTGILLESTNGKAQMHRRIFFHAYI